MFERYRQFPERWWQVLGEVESVAEEVGATTVEQLEET